MYPKRRQTQPWVANKLTPSVKQPLLDRLIWDLEQEALEQEADFGLDSALLLDDEIVKCNGEEVKVSKGRENDLKENELYTEEKSLFSENEISTFSNKFTFSSFAK